MGQNNPKEYAARPPKRHAQVLTFAQTRCNRGTMTANLDTLFSALADPTRREILTMLLEDDMAVTDVAEPFDISLAAISKHLMILSKAGLISQERRGRVNWCKLEPTAMKDVTVWVEGFGQFEAVNLEAFEAYLAQSIATETTSD